MVDVIQKQILRLYRQGRGLKRISKAVGLTPTAIKKRLIKTGIYKGALRGTPGNREEIITLIDRAIARIDNIIKGNG